MQAVSRSPAARARGRPAPAPGPAERYSATAFDPPLARIEVGPGAAISGADAFQGSPITPTPRRASGTRKLRPTGPPFLDSHGTGPAGSGEDHMGNPSGPPPGQRPAGRPPFNDTPHAPPRARAPGCRPGVLQTRTRRVEETRTVPITRRATEAPLLLPGDATSPSKASPHSPDQRHSAAVNEQA